MTILNERHFAERVICHYIASGQLYIIETIYFPFQPFYVLYYIWQNMLSYISPTCLTFYFFQLNPYYTHSYLSDFNGYFATFMHLYALHSSQIDWKNLYFLRYRLNLSSTRYPCSYLRLCVYPSIFITVHWKNASTYIWL